MIKLSPVMVVSWFSQKKKHFIEDHPTKDSRQIYCQIDKLFHRRIISHVFTYRGPMLTLSCGGSHLELAIDKKNKKNCKGPSNNYRYSYSVWYKVIAIPHMVLWVWYAKKFSNSPFHNFAQLCSMCLNFKH